MAENLILQEHILSDFTAHQTGFYLKSLSGAFTLTPGNTYKVVWDSDTYTCVAYENEAFLGKYAVFLGNEEMLTTGNMQIVEPFLIYYMPDNQYDIFFAVNQNEHIVSIYHVVEDEEPEAPEEPEEPVEPEEPEGIVLKDRNGKDVAYYGIETVTFDTTTEGKQQVYTKGVAVENLEIVPDFSVGDMPVVAPAGTLVKSAVIKKPDALAPENVRNGVEVGGVAGTFIGDIEAVEVALSMADGDQVVSPSAAGKVLSGVTIKKPETLISENIAKDVNIAGVIGTLKGGGATVAVGEISSNTTSVTYTHNLGVIPDIIFLVQKETSTLSGSAGDNKYISIFAASSAFVAAHPLVPCGSEIRKWSSNLYPTVYTTPMDQATGLGQNRIYNVTSTRFTIVPQTLSSIYIAIGGLT